MQETGEDRNKIIVRLCGEMASYCAYRERSPKEVADKLFRKDTPSDIAEEVILRLKKEKFLDEDRFAYAFANDKFRLQKWGRVKIRQHLRMHQVDQAILEANLYKATPDEAYEEVLINLLDKKASTLSKEPLWQKKQKCTRFLLQRGFEGDIIKDIMDSRLG